MQKIVENAMDSFDCYDKQSLHAFLLSRATPSEFPHGKKYEFPNGLVVNVYNSSSVTIQGQDAKGELANQVRQLVELTNKKL